jgi:hypothetical protein
MARFHYDLTGAEPIVRDVPVYDASTTAGFALGEFLMLGNTAAGSADNSVAFQTGYESSQATSMVDGLGITQEALADGTNAAGTSFAYLKAIINPFAVYLTEYDQSSAIAFTTSTTTITLTGTLEDNIDLGWIYVVTSAVSNEYALRQLTASTSGSATMDSALVTTETAGTVIKVLPVNHELVNLTTDAKKILMQAAAAAGVSLGVIENYIDSPAIGGLTPLRAAAHRAKNSLSSTTKLFADLVMLNHIYNKID